MSGIAGTQNLDGAPADRETLQRITHAMAHRGADGRGIWVDGAVGLGHLTLHTTPESLGETQPLAMGNPELCITLDGRVDNRDELRAALIGSGRVPRSDTDAELVVLAYACWGEDCPDRIVGDFAFAIWDRKNKKLFCARDPAGFRPFYYVFDGRAFTFSSELHPLLGIPRFDPRLNLGMLAEYLCDSIQNREETLYQNISRLAPGHRLVLQDGNLKTTRYYRIDPNRSIRYRSDAEYAEHFFEIFRESVRCRLRSQTPVALLLSGGVDSSSILGMVGHLENEGATERGHVRAYTLAYSHPDADERNYAQAAARMWGGTLHAVDASDVAAEPRVEQTTRIWDLPSSPGNDQLRSLLTLARGHGSRVCLWGYGGDELFTGDLAHCADSLRRLDIFAFLRQLRHGIGFYRQTDAGQNALRDILKSSFYPLVPGKLKSRIKRALNWNVPRWITPAFARAVDLQDRLMQRAGARGFPTYAQRAIHGVLEGGYIAFAHEEFNRFDAGQGIEGRSPLYDRRIIEFALAVPEDQRWRGDQTKFVLRHAMKGIIPESIRQRRSKADFSFELVNSFAKEQAGKAFDSMQLAELGYVDAMAVRNMYRQCVQGDLRPIGPLWMILASERWLNNESIMGRR